MFKKKKPSSNERRKHTIFSTLDDNLGYLKSLYQYPKNKDFKYRNLYVQSLECEGVIVFLKGTVDVKVIEQFVVKPLLHYGSSTPIKMDDLFEFLLEKILTTTSGEKMLDLEKAGDALLSGHSLLFLEGVPSVLSIDTTGFQSRAIEKTQNENVLKGPKEAFVESGEKNLSLIRKMLRDHNLVSESLQLGREERNQIQILYLNNIVDPELIDKVKMRINQIDADSVQQLSLLEQHIEERPYSLLPTVLVTERPDRASAFLREGHIILLSENSPYALVTPVTFWSLFHTAEDYYERWFYGNFIRLIRIFAMMIALLTPGIYIAATNYHVEMLPTDLLLAISATREQVPFPAIFEVLLMETTFELLREAGIRIPTAIGPTIGIVGALILGQAAVDANIVSPIMVIVVAITGLSSFAIPEISLSFLIRILRFAFLFAGATMGFYGIATLFVVCIGYMASFNNFGVPFLSPMAPHYPSSKDLIIRPPLWKLWLRPYNMRPKLTERAKKPTKGE